MKIFVVVIVLTVTVGHTLAQGPACGTTVCADDGECESDVCVCPLTKPLGNGYFFCYAPSDNRRVGTVFGDPYSETMIPGEHYKIPLPCSGVLLKGPLPNNCYIDAYFNGPNIADPNLDMTKVFINGLDIFVYHGDDATRMHFTDTLTLEQQKVAVDQEVNDNGVITVTIPVCDVMIKYRHSLPFVVINIPMTDEHYRGVMLPSSDFHESLEAKAAKYNIEHRQEILYTNIHNIDSRDPECENLYYTMSENCTTLADQDISTGICGEYVFSENMVQCLRQTLTVAQILVKMTLCIEDVCLKRHPPCTVIENHFEDCTQELDAGMDKYCPK